MLDLLYEYKHVNLTYKVSKNGLIQVLNEYAPYFNRFKLKMQFYMKENISLFCAKIQY